MFVVYNKANTNATIVSKKGPCIRILGFASLEKAQNMSMNKIVETRIWPMKQWRTITDSKDLSDKALQQEYEDIDVRVQDWNTYRESVSKEVYQASKGEIERPIEPIRAATMVYTSTSSQVKQIENFDCIEIGSLEKSEEVRGQEFALIAITGDASYERSRELVFKDLGKKYALALQEATKLDSFDLQTLEQEYYKTHDSSNMAEIVLKDVKEAKSHLDILSFEPAISFLGFSDIDTT